MVKKMKKLSENLEQQLPCELRALLTFIEKEIAGDKDGNRI